MHGNRACMAAENVDVGVGHSKMLAGPGGQKAPSSMGKLSTPEVLRLRAIKRCVTRPICEALRSG